MDQRARLAANGVSHGRVAVAEGIHRNSAYKIQVFLAVGVPEPGALPLYRSQRNPTNIAHQVLINQFHNFLCIHPHPLLSL